MLKGGVGSKEDGGKFNIQYVFNLPLLANGRGNRIKGKGERKCREANKNKTKLCQ